MNGENVLHVRESWSVIVELCSVILRERVCGTAFTKKERGGLEAHTFVLRDRERETVIM